MRTPLFLLAFSGLFHIVLGHCNLNSVWSRQPYDLNNCGWHIASQVPDGTWWALGIGKVGEFPNGTWWSDIGFDKIGMFSNGTWWTNDGFGNVTNFIGKVTPLPNGTWWTDGVGKNQQDDPGFRCGVCGDDINPLYPIIGPRWDGPVNYINGTTPRLHELGNPNVKGYPSVAYRAGGNFTIGTTITNTHFGFLQFRACCNVTQQMNTNVTIAQQCFNDNLLSVLSATATPDKIIYDAVNNQVNITVNARFNFTGFLWIHTVLQIPTYLTSDFCTVQLNYRTDQLDGFTGKETFRGCLDARFVPQNEYQFLKNVKYQKCLSQTKGSNMLTLSTCDTEGSNSMQSIITPQPWSEYVSTRNNTILFESTGNCLDPTDWNTIYLNSAIASNDCTTFENEYWWIEGNVTGSFQILNKFSATHWKTNSRLCLTAAQFESSESYNVTVTTCNSADDSQNWTLYDPLNFAFN